MPAPRFGEDKLAGMTEKETDPLPAVCISRLNMK
jgi:hypothetical protein